MLIIVHEVNFDALNLFVGRLIIIKDENERLKLTIEARLNHLTIKFRELDL